MLVAIVLVLGLAAARQFDRTDSLYAERLDSCWSKDFNRTEYLRQRGGGEENNKKGITLMSNSWVDLRFFRKDIPFAHFLTGPGHEWIRFGNGTKSCLAQDMNVLREIRNSGNYTLDTEGCVPYLDRLEQYHNMKTCLKEGNLSAPNGSFVYRNDGIVKRQFTMYEVQPMDRYLYYFSILASRENATWITDEAVDEFYSHDEAENAKARNVISTCRARYPISRNEMKCFTTMMAAPGYATFKPETIIDAPFKLRRFSTEMSTCNVNPVCGRIAMEKLYYMQTMDYGMLEGIPKAWNLRHTKHNPFWLNTTFHNETTPHSRLVHSRCQLKSSNSGKTICWHFSRCMQEILKSVCRENPGCCPTPQVHAACKADITSRNCNICKLRPFASIYNLFKALARIPGKISRTVKHLINKH